MNVVSLDKGIFQKQVFTAGQVVPVHHHRDPYISFVYSGDYLETNGKDNFHCRRNSVVVHPPGDCHANKVNARSIVFSLFFGESCFLRLSQNAAALRPCVFSSPAIETLFRKLAEEFAATDPFSPLMVEGLSLEIFAEVFRKAGRAEAASGGDQITTILEVLHDQIEENLSLDDIAAATGMEKFVVSRAFKNATGVTVGEYQRNLKVQKAKDLLENSTLALAEVALAAGFYDQSHFIRVFRRETRTTPLKYRKIFRAA